MVARWEPESHTFHRRLRCSSCRTERVQLLNQRGHVITNHYVYPEGYLAKNVEGMAGNRDTFRLEAVIRTLNDSDIRAIRKAVG